MTRVLFLAQNPASARCVEHPLDGTRSRRTFDMWLRILGSPDHLLLNASRKVGRVSHRDYDAVTVSAAVAECDRYVALGLYASGLLERLGVRHFVLPHPSGRNRKLNDKDELDRQLALCRTYIRSNAK